jgi:hypothetical protein
MFATPKIGYTLPRSLLFHQNINALSAHSGNEKIRQKEGIT